MLERGGDLRLALEALAEGLVPAQLRREELQRDRALQADVLRAVHDAHAPVPDQGHKAIPCKLVTDPRNPAHIAHGEGF